MCSSVRATDQEAHKSILNLVVVPSSKPGTGTIVEGSLGLDDRIRTVLVCGQRTKQHTRERTKSRRRSLNKPLVPFGFSVLMFPKLDADRSRMRAISSGMWVQSNSS